MHALECLLALTKLPYHLLHPHKNDVIARVGKCLDDKKRLVRQQAVLCRNKWYSL